MRYRVFYSLFQGLKWQVKGIWETCICIINVLDDQVLISIKLYLYHYTQIENLNPEICIKICKNVRICTKFTSCNYHVNLEFSFQDENFILYRTGQIECPDWHWKHLKTIQLQFYVLDANSSKQLIGWF